MENYTGIKDQVYT